MPSFAAEHQEWTVNDMSNPMIRTVSTTLSIIREIDPHSSISRGLIEQEIDKGNIYVTKMGRKTNVLVQDVYEYFYKSPMPDYNGDL